MNYKKATKKIKLILKDNEEKTIQRIVDFLQSNFTNYTWVGVYLLKNNILSLGPWKGPHATEHTEIQIGDGICGAAAKTGKTENIPDVNKDNRYLSCFISTRAEIVVPIIYNKKVLGEIDIDSDTPNAFSQKDEAFLEKIADMLAEHIHNHI